MNATVLAILVLAVLMAAIIGVSLLVLRRVGGRAERRADELRGEVEGAGDESLVPLAGAVYQGGGSRTFPAGATGCFGSPPPRRVPAPRRSARQRAARARHRRPRGGPPSRRRGAHRHRLVLILDDDGGGLPRGRPLGWQATLGPRARAPLGRRG